MEQILKFLKDSGVFYIATQDGSQPRVRPFGAIAKINGKICLITGKKKDVYKQIKTNPKIEISSMYDNKWLRLSADAVELDDRDARIEMLQQNPSLSGMYNPDDGVMAVLSLENADAKICSFTEAPVEIRF